MSLNQLPVRMLAVLVLYKMKPSESVAFNTLQKARSCVRRGQADIKILLYDNTPGGQDAGVLPADVQYKADLDNGGLAKAYNWALEIAHENGFDWLLTLDQDTDLPLDFLSKLSETVTVVAPMSSVAAIVPCVRSDGLVISPVKRMKYLPGTRHFPDGFIGISLAQTYAVNSASTIRVGALKAIGGYDPRFHLDESDIVMYHRLQCDRFRIFVAGNIHVKHEVSIFDLKNRSTIDRYEATLRAEEAFYDEYMGRLERAALPLKMSYLLVYKLWRTGGSLPYFRIGLKFLCRRLFWSRERRMESWNGGY